MNRYLQYGSVEAIPYYNCSWKSFEEWEETGIKRPYLGWPLVIFGTCIELIYIPIIYIIFKTNLIKHACYKIIVVLISIDMSATFCSCLITGPLLIIGSVFCMYPTFTYLAGGIALVSWCMACAATVSLFANRVISIAFREYADAIEKKLAYSSIAFIFLYGAFIYIFTPTVCYNSVIMAWIANPLSEEFPSAEADEAYRNPTQAWNNWIFLVSIFTLFSVYFCMVKKLAQGQKSKASRSIFIQCSIICFFNTCIALVYNALNYITLSPGILIFVQCCWAMNHASPAFIYMTMNHTIRREYKKLVFGVLSQKVEDTSTAKVTTSQSRI
ncbi:Protein CBG13764 [Caenorhabditis briggsae]|uniref:Uncharacterized protein n=2 Tax=Caenorhabditis briggsae TaxID=6238 RepID=A0AAE9ELJ2_CAEBR|nr:Protein CBG13764 [Caenorhabditis briggsae]ULT93292.1 hypothetical protein L3Y34_003048 [Caenorhabditis briggsae]UMM26557.1 hypothetical protein L5515_010207 [Caenorhabditis briggsae]CAP32505.1 Protein CBG13764 [Caenorhabditis briggsae]